MKTGILLLNLGTPDSFKTSDVRKYLVQFLTDWRVIDIPAVRRHLLVRGIIGPFRAPKSAATYKEVWTEEGSPLLVITQKLAALVQEALGSDYQVEFGMRYGNPSTESALKKFEGKALKKLRVIPLYPQYASASTGTASEEVMRIISNWQTIIPVEFLSSYHDHPGLINSWTEIGKKYDPASYDHILFSYHGLPERQLVKADFNNHCLKNKDCCATLTDKNAYCYSAQCYDTTKYITEALDIPKEKHTVCFQSRLGKTPWREPFTSDVIAQLAKEGKKKLLVFCPAFVSDCLETIYEVKEEYKEEFVEAGGEELTLVESLNTHPLWVDTVKALATEPL